MIDSLEKERKEFEAAGTKLHGGGPLDYRISMSSSAGRIDYIWSTQRYAFALWLYAKGIKV